MRRGLHRIQAERLLERAEHLMADEAYVRLRGYNEIDVMLRAADIHLRLAEAKP